MDAATRAWNKLVSGDDRWSIASGHVCALVRCSGRFFNNYSLRGLTCNLIIRIIIILLCNLFLICQRYLLFVAIIISTVTVVISRTWSRFLQDVEVGAFAAINESELWRNDLTDALRYRAFDLHNSFGVRRNFRRFLLIGHNLIWISCLTWFIIGARCSILRIRTGRQFMCFILIDYNFFDHWSDDLSLLRGRWRAELLSNGIAIIAPLSAIVTTSCNGRIHRYAFLFHPALALVVLVILIGGGTKQERSIAASGRSHNLLHGLLVRDNNLIGFGSGRCGGGSRCHRVIQLKILGDLRVRVILWGLRITGHVVLLVVEGRSAGRLDVQPIGKCLLHWLVRRLVQTCRLRVKLISIVRVVHVGGCGHLLLL